MYYDGNEMLTHDRLINFLVGGRGVGKTYWAKKWAITDFLKTGKQFVYLRRFSTEFDEGKKEEFFKDIEVAYPEHKFEVKGYKALIDGKVAGFFKVLSTAKVQKSVPFPNVNKLIFDEFILDNGYHHYLPDEVINFFEFYSTVSRDRDIRAVCLSNALTISNPYFTFFKAKIDPMELKRWYKPHNDILIEMIKSVEYEKKMEQTRFGKLIKGTRYGDYALSNKFLRDSKTFIGGKTGTAKYHFTIKHKGQLMGIWYDNEINKYFVSKSVDKQCKLIYTIVNEDHTNQTQLIKGRKSIHLMSFAKAYQLGEVIFESIALKNTCFDIIKLFI